MKELEERGTRKRGTQKSVKGWKQVEGNEQIEEGQHKKSLKSFSDGVTE